MNSEIPSIFRNYIPLVEVELVMFIYLLGSPIYSLSIFSLLLKCEETKDPGPWWNLPSLPCLYHHLDDVG